MTIEKKQKEKKIEFGNNMRIYWSIARPYLWIFIALSIIITITDLAKIGEKFLIKIIIDDGTKFSSGEIAINSFMSVVLLVIIAYLIMISVRTCSKWIHMHLINRLDSGIIFDIKKKFFNHIVGLSHRFHTTHKTGSLISRLTRGGRAAEGISDFILFNGLPLLVQFVIAGASILYFDKISAIVLALTTISFVIYSIFILKLHQKPHLEANEFEDREKAIIGDVFTNIDSIKYFGKENTIKSIFHKFSDKTRRGYIKAWDYYRWLDSGQTLIIGIGLFLIIYSPMVKFIHGEISIGTLVFLYSVYLSMADPLYGFVWGVRRFYEAMADFQALFEYEKIENEIKDKPNAEVLDIKNGEIEFKDVSFKYHNRKIIDNINLKIKPNEKIALVGHSGSGKTTLVKLLYRLYELDKGEIFIDNKNIKNFKQESLRSELSIVPQECILFDDTIYSNIAFSRPSASKEEVMQAMKFAQLDKFVNGLPNKEKTIVGERGVKLSGGEKQRVSIARAILANQKVLVLDEATSSLDSKTEYEIQKDLQKLMAGRTSIVIAHRLSTIMQADRIVVLEKGKIVQIGRHSELIRKPGVYRELWNLQKGGYLGE